VSLLVLFVAVFVNVLFLGLTIVILGRVLLSWIPTRLPWGLNDFIFSVSEPILAPIRRMLPMAGGMDLSPLVAFVLLRLVESLLVRLLAPVL
jgi:YggT family protein